MRIPMKRLAVVLAFSLAAIGTLGASASEAGANTTPTIPYGGYGNLTSGDCQSAAVGDMVQTWLSSGPVPQWEIGRLYHAVNPYVDSPRLAQIVFSYWRQHPIGGVVPVAWREVRPERDGHYGARQIGLIRHDVQRFGALYAFANVPNTDGGVYREWTVADSLPHWHGTFGHAFAVVGASAQGLTIVTWGQTQIVSWGWWDAYGYQLWTVSHTEVSA